MKSPSLNDIYTTAMTMLGNDTFIYGETLHGETKKEIIEKVIKNLTEFMNTEDDDDSKNGYRISVEIFKKGEPGI